MDCQLERTIHMMEDMLLCCVLYSNGDWGITWLYLSLRIRVVISMAPHQSVVLGFIQFVRMSLPHESVVVPNEVLLMLSP